MIEFYVFTFGLFMGSFLNVVADRLTNGITLLGRSKCESCNHKLSWRDLIPIISFIELRGKCRYCRASFSNSYFITEIFTGVVYLLTYILSQNIFDNYLITFLHLLIVSVLIVMVISDIKYQIINDEMQILLFIFGSLRLYLLANYLIFNIGETFQLYAFSLLNGVLVMLPILLIFTISKGRGMGFADVKFAFIAGFILGLFGGLLSIYIAFVTGGLFGILLIIFKKVSRKSKIAFGPFLVLGFYIVMFYSDYLIKLIQSYYIY